MFSRLPIGLGRVLKNQMCATGTLSSMWPMRSRRTLRQRHLDAAAVADDAAVADPLVLAAMALPVLDRTEDPLAEETVPFRLEGAVVDGLRLGRPRPTTTRSASPAAPGAPVPWDRGARGSPPGPRSGSRCSRSSSSWARARCENRSCYSSPSAVAPSVTLSPSACSSLTSTLKDSGIPGSGQVLALHDRLVDLAPAVDVVRLDREHLLEEMGRAVGLERPHFHFTEPLAAELRLAGERLLGDQRVRPDRAGVDLVVHQVATA